MKRFQQKRCTFYRPFHDRSIPLFAARQLYFEEPSVPGFFHASTVFVNIAHRNYVFVEISTGAYYCIPSVRTEIKA